jgi:hypothetical protein
MKGIVFNLLEDFICENWGHAKYEEILALCPAHVGHTYVAPETYPDEHLSSIAAKAAQALGIPLPDALRAFGKFAFGKLAARYPIFLEGHIEPRTFLLSVEKVIHVEVRKLFKNAVTPSFTYREAADGGLVIEYRSARKLCPLMEGLIQGTAEWFGQPIAARQDRCMHRGDECCEFHLGFPVRKAA